MILNKDDSIVTAYAEPCSGPGWSNSPIWVIVRDGLGKIHQECIQPEEQTQDMAIFYSTSAAVHNMMTRIVERGYKG